MYTIVNSKNSQFFCGTWVMNGRFYTNGHWSTNRTEALVFGSEAEAKEALESDPFPSTCKITIL